MRDGPTIREGSTVFNLGATIPVNKLSKISYNFFRNFAITTNFGGILLSLSPSVEPPLPTIQNISVVLVPYTVLKFPLMENTTME